METEEERPVYEVKLTDEAVYGYAAVFPQAIYDRIGFLIGNLSRFSFYGGEYRPYYRASCPDIPCRVFYCGHFGVYYHVDEEQELVTVLAIEDERMDPLGRFAPYGGN